MVLSIAGAQIGMVKSASFLPVATPLSPSPMHRHVQWIPLAPLYAGVMIPIPMVIPKPVPLTKFSQRQTALAVYTAPAL